MRTLKLYMVLLGSKPPGRHVEQHDFFFGIAASVSELLPHMKAFWPEAAGNMHIDAWREVTDVDGYKVNVAPNIPVDPKVPELGPALFFINLGGYQEGKFEEQHYVLLTVKPDKATALKEAKSTLFYRDNHFGKAVSHLDDKYGIDVDDLYQIEDIVSAEQKKLYKIKLVPSIGLADDELHLGYLKLSDL